MSDEPASKVVTFDYTNWKGETGRRRVYPVGIRFGSNQWHPAPQWLLDAVDLDRTGGRFVFGGVEVDGALRTFAVKDISGWTPGESI